MGDLPGDRQNRDNQGIWPMPSLLGSRVKGEGPCELLLLASIRPVELITLKETEKEKAGVRCQKAVCQFLRSLVRSIDAKRSPPRHSPNRK